MNQTDISIIVPIYNAEKFISKCINSILNQTYSDFELLLINDGSTDNSGEICEEYADQDNRIKVFHKKNSGPSDTRNIGLNEAKGKWIVFIDADDWVGEKYLESFFYTEKIEEKNHIIQGCQTLSDTGENRDDFLSRQYSFEIISTNDYNSSIPKNDLLKKWEIWSKLFSLKIINENNLRFNSNLRAHEDAVFWHQYILHIKSFVLLPSKEYRYIRPSSNDRVTISNEKHDYKLYYQLAKKYKGLYSQLIFKFNLEQDSYKYDIISLYIDNYISSWKQLSLFSKNKTKIVKQLVNISPPWSIMWLYKPKSYFRSCFKFNYLVIPLNIFTIFIRE